MSQTTRRELLKSGAALAALGLAGGEAMAQRGSTEGPPQRFSSGELVDNGHKFFGSMSRGLAQVVEEATRRWGQPNAYILGQEASGAFIAGARYGEGQMYTRNAGQQRVFWQGPSVGFDAGADGRFFGSDPGGQ